ncbi:MAG: DNA ligase-associated DEXH box helicase [bacterium]|nr:DNA ligase-associated DEXH box helicase [bacterium]
MNHWIEPYPTGIYVRPADAWIDPSTPRERALVTHGHADPARGGHGHVWATRETLAIMALRYGTASGTAVGYGEEVRVGGVTIRYVPAGHVLGSAQIVLDHAGERVVVTGDYKRRPDPTCLPFEPVPCDIFVTEATFGLPVFRHPDTGSEIDRLLAALHANPDRCVLVGAYALGKAQRVMGELRARGHHDAIYIHGAMERMCALYANFGVEMGELRPAAGVAAKDMRGHIVIAPPSGWMRVRQRARQRNVELPLVISDHADWDELTDTLREVAPRETWITHGREEALLHWCMTHQMRARALALVGREDEEEEG